MELHEQGTETVWRASEIDMGTRCSRQLGYRRLGTVENPGPMSMPPGWALLGGLSMDDSLTAFTRGILSGKCDLVGSALTDFFVERLRTNVAKQTEPIQGEDDPREIENDGVKVLPLYERQYGACTEPVAVQEEVRAQVGAVTLVGHVDLIRKIEGDEVIVDWKFTKKTPKQMPASLYSRNWAYRLMRDETHKAKADGTELVYLRRGLVTPKVEQDIHFVTEGEKTQVKRQVSSVVAMYQARYFPMTDPGNWWCSAKFCGFHKVCRGRDKGPLPIPGEGGVQ